MEKTNDQRWNEANSESMELSIVHVGRQFFMEQLMDDMIPVRSVASDDQMKAINAGVRLVLDCIDSYGYQIVGEDGVSINPPHEKVDFQLATLWDNYAAAINS